MDTTLPPGLATHLAGRVDAVRRRYRRRLERCHEKFSEGAVHELRVETRRVLALIDLLEALHFEDSLKKLRKTFKKRLDAFDALRDTQVQLRLLKPLWREFPEAREFRSVLRRVEKRLIAKLARKIGTTKQGRLNRRLRQIQEDLRGCLDVPLHATSDTLASAVLQEAFARVAALRRQVRAKDTATIHRTRVAFKRFRYMSELLQPLLPGLTAPRLGRMREYQAMAGDIQDLEVLLARLAELVEQAGLPPETTGRLLKELLRQRQRAIRSFMARIDDLFEFEPQPMNATGGS